MRLRSAKLEIDIVSIREYRMERTRDTRRTAFRLSTRTAALVVAVAGLLTGGVLAAPPTPAATPLALPDGLGPANRAW